MYSESDIRTAIEAGILTPETADALRRHVEDKRHMAAADEEHFRLLGGFNDVFITLAIMLLLALPVSLGNGFVVGFVCWGLAELVTRQRRIALPSIVLAATFAEAIYVEVLSQVDDVFSGRPQGENSIPYAAAAAAAFAATFGYWLRFRVPITQAILAGFALAGAVFIAAGSLLGGWDLVWPMLGLGGLAIFAYAMWWDLADRERRTHRSDVAFWLHLLSAPSSPIRSFGRSASSRGTPRPGRRWSSPFTSSSRWSRSPSTAGRSSSRGSATRWRRCRGCSATSEAAFSPRRCCSARRC